MTAAFNDSGLMHVDVSGVGSNDSLPGQQDRIDDRGICLRSTDQEMNVRFGRIASLSNQVTRALAVLVGTVATRLLHISGDQGVQYFLVRAFLIITGEIRDYSCASHCTIIARFLP